MACLLDANSGSGRRAGSTRDEGSAGLSPDDLTVQALQAPLALNSLRALHAPHAAALYAYLSVPIIRHLLRRALHFAALLLRLRDTHLSVPHLPSTARRAQHSDLAFYLYG